MSRKDTKVVHIGDRVIGGGNPVLIQSMCNTKTEDVKSTINQILSLEKAGCDIIRCAVPTMEAAEALSQIKKTDPYSAGCGHPFLIIAFAIAAMDERCGQRSVSIRENIGSKERIQAVVDTAKERNIPYSCRCKQRFP